MNDLNALLSILTVIGGIAAIIQIANHAISLYKWLSLVFISEQNIPVSPRVTKRRWTFVISLLIIIMILGKTIIEIVSDIPLTRYSVAFICVGISLTICYLLFLFISISLRKIVLSIQKAQGTATKALKYARMNL